MLFGSPQTIRHAPVISERQQFLTIHFIFMPTCRHVFVSFPLLVQYLRNVLMNIPESHIRLCHS